MKIINWLKNSVPSISRSSKTVLIRCHAPDHGIWAGRQNVRPKQVALLTYPRPHKVLEIARFTAKRCPPVDWTVGGEDWDMSEDSFARLVAELSKLLGSSTIHIDSGWLDRLHPTFEARLRRFGVATERESSPDESDSRSAA